MSNTISSMAEAYAWLDNQFGQPKDPDDNVNYPINVGPFEQVAYDAGNSRRDAVAIADAKQAMLHWDTRDMNIGVETQGDPDALLTVALGVRTIRDKMLALGYYFESQEDGQGTMLCYLTGKSVAPANLPREVQAVIDAFRDYVGPLTKK
jgi:hypothetical protein